MERIERSSLLQALVNNGLKKFSKIGPRNVNKRKAMVKLNVKGNLVNPTTLQAK
jgi:hypothetical protein